MSPSAPTKLINIIVPFYNEERNLPLLYESIKQSVKKLSYNFQYLFVNDNSRDRSSVFIKKLAKSDSSVKLLDLTRNFGKEAALTAGLHHARGDAAIMLDADLQHPPEYIPEFVKAWEKGAEVVVGVRKTKKGEVWHKKFSSKMFYSLINKISEIEITPNATDYRLLDRIVIDEFNRLSERNRITRGLIDWLGFKRAYVHFIPKKRRHGIPSYSLKKLITLAINSILSMSMLPLLLALYLGIAITIVSGILGAFIFTVTYILDDPWHFNFSGPAILAVILLFLVGIILICLGLIGLYIARIHNEVANRPLYVRRKRRSKS